MSRRYCWLCAALGAAVALAVVSLFLKPLESVQAKEKIRVLCWSERTEPADIYPNGINGAIAAMLNHEKDITAKAVNLSDPGQGLTDEALNNTDVLIWFGHKKHAEVTDENVQRVVRRVQDGMGYMPIHSAHYAKPFQQILERIAEVHHTPLTTGQKPGQWDKVRNEGKPELIHVLMPKHPIARGVKDFTIPQTESYNNPFNIPAPDAKIFEGRYESGQQDGNDGLLWNFGSGKIFYFRPGHETFPIYLQTEVQRILRNGVRFLAVKTT